MKEYQKDFIKKLREKHIRLCRQFDPTYDDRNKRSNTILKELEKFRKTAASQGVKRGMESG